LDDVDEFSCADSDARAEAEFASQMRFHFIAGPSGETQKFSDDCLDLVSSKFSVISTSDTIANILHLQLF